MFRTASSVSSVWMFMMLVFLFGSVRKLPNPVRPQDIDMGGGSGKELPQAVILAKSGGAARCESPPCCAS